VARRHRPNLGGDPDRCRRRHPLSRRRHARGVHLTTGSRPHLRSNGPQMAFPLTSAEKMLLIPRKLRLDIENISDISNMGPIWPRPRQPNFAHQNGGWQRNGSRNLGLDLVLVNSAIRGAVKAQLTLSYLTVIYRQVRPSQGGGSIGLEQS